MVLLLDNYVDGLALEPRETGRLEVFNPARDTVICEIPDSSADTVDRAVAAAKAAQPAWKRLPAIQRAAALRKISGRIRENADRIARVISEEQGKPLPLATLEANFTAEYLDYMAEWARRIEGEVISSDRPGETVLLLRQPIGVVAGILPWNFPFFLIARKLGPALITGNTIVIKPSEETPHNAALFVELLQGLDLPRGVINFVHGSGRTTGEALSRHPDVGLISFTGSVPTGSRIMANAAANITKVNLELGGKAPAIVLGDADIPAAIRNLAASRVLNSGQLCNCPERLYVERKVADEFVSGLANAMKATRYGDPLGDSEIDMGPLINRAGLDKVRKLVDSALSEGAEVVTGGKVADLGTGNYFEPTVLLNVQQNSPIMRQEIFGPVLPVNIVDSLDEAIERANDSEFGLTSSIFTRDLASAFRACNELEFGETYVNRDHFEAMQGFHAGTKKSGIGGADGKHGLYEYTMTHVSYIQN
ncbi:aldehyde dehydrogenase [Lichenicoccus roseus]|uniref:Aldehyde dehydrogenase n=1 Tax=Lichenicoccus roseus TaxID=2683649 RepID=A0A5R9J9M5_9PROT|nr:aldehyde dehydrogenase [Lichenicoccus roseus]TLU70928.1 aldehyde dehydrogenase [Lichenicoccus roseus]